MNKICYNANNANFDSFFHEIEFNSEGQSSSKKNDKIKKLVDVVKIDI